MSSSTAEAERTKPRAREVTPPCSSSDIARSLDQWMGIDECFVDLDAQACDFRRLDATIGVERVGHAADLVAERIMLGDIALEIAGDVDRSEHVDRRGHV